jgi:hypothetical protein
MFPIYARIGKCKQCGFCCASLTVWSSSRIHRAFTSESRLIKIQFNEVCPKYNRREHKCMCHDDQPNICKDFPLHPDQQIVCSDECGYSFILVDFDFL